ncbi:GL26230 [Drosophila persimilis]|uniref:GL26230 n=1 Tax=Drosophila persimilis TaxID=7234 RepID=B4GJ80_DROPE|nr:GL26230 [Drosophila persimilis]
MVVFIFVNHNGELKPDSPQSKLSRKPNLEPITLHNKSVIKNVQPATVLDPQKINIQTIEKTPISVAENFFVFSPKCKIPYVDPLSEDFLNLSVPYPYKTCTEDPDLFSVLYHRKTKHYILHLNKEVMNTRFSNISNYACFYFETMAGTNDSYAVARRAELFENDFIVPHHFLGLVVQCNDLDNNSRVLQADAFSFVQHPVDRNETSDAWRGTNYPSVFLFGIDTMSRMNFHRTMPLTSKFVRHSGWYEMEGYNKVADNTLPNLLAVLTGRSAKNWSKGCNLKTAGCFNYITYLWDHFHNAGYLTAYAEDLSSISTFNYLKSGFVRKPVDFYLRPFVTILEHVLKSVEWIGCKYCLGRRHSFSYVFDYAKQLIQRFVHETPKPLFGFFWTSSFTHDDHSGLQQPVDITPDMPLDKNMNGIITECHDEKNPSRIIQKDAFPLVQVVNQTSRTGSHPVDIQPSVIMLGLDTMSRMNFRRTMPRTAEFVRKLGWFELEGYNKVADNTYPNLCTVLAGGTPEELKKICSFSYAEDQDSCPWIWRDYKKAGYSTAYGEDIVEDSVFSVHDSGFRHEPTDFYLRPLLMGLTHSMRTYRRFGYDYCLGRRITVSYLYDFCMQFAQRFIEELEQPAFGFFWSCTFTHDYHHGASSLDGIFMDYLELLETRQVFEKSIVILLSDHGERFGELVELSDGFLEERLPMLHIYLPPWFRKTYNRFAQSLYLNRNRLSSPYDLHNTLRHILQLNASTSDQLPPLTNCPTSQSLLHTLPRERSCKDACIGDHWCTCNEFMAIKLNGDAYNIVKLTLFYINRWLVLNQYNQKCDRLCLEDLDYAERKVLNEDNGQESLYGTISIYRLRFHTNPPSGRFEATVRYDNNRKRLSDFNIDDVSRLNRYHNDSLCIEDKIAKKFCFCRGTFDPDWTNQ